MKRFFLISSLVLLPFYLFAQQSPADLRAKLATAGNDSLKIAAYKELITYYSLTKPDSEESFGNEALKYAATRKYAVGEGMIIEHLGTIDKNQGRMDLAEKRLNHALNIYQKTGYLKGIAGITNSLGAIESIKGNYDVAIKLFISALKLHERFTDDEGLMLTYLNLGCLYLQHNDEANTNKYLGLAKQMGDKMPLTDATISVYNTIGISDVAKGDSIKGLQLFQNDLKLSDRPEFATSHIECLSYLGRYYLDHGSPDTALQYLMEGLRIAREKNLPELQANISLDIGQILSATNPKEAFTYLNTAKEICQSIHDRSFLVIVYDEIAAVYKQQGKYKDALDATEQKQKVADSIFSINKTMELAGMGYEYESEKANMRVSQLEQLSNKNAEQRNVFIIIAFAIIIMLFVLFFYYRKSTALNRQLTLRKEDLKTLNAMKDKLFSVIGHDLRGPLASIPAILDIYEDESTGPEEQKFILDNLKEHSKVSLETLDKLLYWGQSLVKGNTIRKMDFHSKGYIKETVEFKRMAAAEKNIKVTDTTSADVYLHADPTHFDFIIRNLLANAIKYTYNNGNISIFADQQTMKEYTIFIVKDNGVGMDKAVLSRLFSPIASTEGTASEKGNGIGLMLCKEFALQNGGDIWVESEPGKGSSFYFSVKKAA